MTVSPNAPAAPAALSPALLLAAGRGERMRPLTDTRPKPMLAVQGQPMLMWHLQALAKAGVRDVVINTAWQEDVLISELGERAAGIALHYSQEGRDFGGALETAGGIVRALPLLENSFWVAAGDVFVPDFVFDTAVFDAFQASEKLAHLFLVPNPAHNPKGDFALTGDDSGALFTFSTIAIYKKALFSPPYCDIPAGNPEGVKAAVAPLLRHAIAEGLVSTQLYTGAWTDVGTPERLAELNRSTTA